MTQIGNVYGQALYSLAKDEGVAAVILEDLQVLRECFESEPAFLRLLHAANISKEERCQIVDDTFRDKVHIYVLNFLKVMTEEGYADHLEACFISFEEQYNLDAGILPVKVVTAVPLNEEQADRLTDKISAITGKKIKLKKVVNPECMGGVRLDFDGRRLDDTVANRLEAIGSLLKKTVL